jgi:serine protease Do
MINLARVRALSTRRLILLATVANLGIAALVVGNPPQSIVPALSTAGAAESAQRQWGFADLVEKVKPAVISVRVKIDSPAKMMGFEDHSPDSQMERFFRRFGMPDWDRQQRQDHRPVTGQGSGFFITADGYAVTNNHVLDKAQTVEVTTDDGDTGSR